MYLYPATSGPDASPSGEPIQFDFPMGPPSAELVSSWVTRHLPSISPVPRISRPINWLKVLTITTLVAGGATAAFVAWPYVMPILQNRNLWAAASLLAVLVFTSGHMFNHIRQTPYVGGNGKGGISYFAGGFQNQYGLETQIVGAICKFDILAARIFGLAVG
jgi:oligosaccharyltransferase complex subunit gamma